MNDINRSLLFFKLLSNCVALIPGMLILRNDLPLPPTFSATLMAGLEEITCCFIVAFAWINGKSVKRLTMRSFNGDALIAFALFFVSFNLYIVLFNYSTINSPDWGKNIFIPIYANTHIIREGGFQQYYDKYGVDELSYLLATKFQTQLILSKIVVCISFLSIFIFLTITFTLLWLKYEVMAVKQKNNAPIERLKRMSTRG